MSISLTIAIPTYNRNETLLENLGYLLPQLTQECKLVIVDNCSDMPVSETLKHTLSNFPNINWELIRNKANIGANANIIRCFEICNTDWLWVLGDDDKIEEDAISKILKNIDLNPDTLYFNFSSWSYSREKAIVTHGLEDFVAKVDSFTNVIFISCGVYKVKKLIFNLKFGYQYSYSAMPLVVLLLVSLEKEGICYLSDEKILNTPPAYSSRKENWSIIDTALYIMIVLELPFNSKIRESLAQKLMQWLELKRIAIQLVLHAIKYDDIRECLYLYDHICYRCYYFDRSIFRKLEILLFRIFISFPKISYKLIELRFKYVLGEEKGKQNLEDFLSNDRFLRL